MRFRPSILLAIAFLGAIGLAALWLADTSEVTMGCVVAIAGLGGKLLEKNGNTPTDG